MLWIVVLALLSFAPLNNATKRTDTTFNDLDNEINLLGHTKPVAGYKNGKKEVSRGLYKRGALTRDGAVVVTEAIEQLLKVLKQSLSSEPGRRIKELESRIGKLEKRVNEDERGFFTATLTNHVKLRSGKTVIFDKVVYDASKDYDATSGKFTCPVDGIYQFQTSMMTHSGSSNYFGVQIMKSGTPLTTVFGKGVYGGNAGQVVVRCDSGEKVWVRVRPGYATIAIYGLEYNSFSGAFLHKV